MQYKESMLSILRALGLLAATTGAQAEGWCESGKAVRFAGLNQENGTLLTELVQFILAKSYGYTTNSLPGSSITMEQVLNTNNIQVFAEEWIGRSDAWNEAIAVGKMVGVGEPIVGAVEDQYMPCYVIEGDPQCKLEVKASKLRPIVDLAQYAEVLRGPEEPSRGRFYNCPAGWACKLESSEILKSYDLEKTFANLRPGTGPALDTVVLSSYRRGEPVLFYYWSSTPLMGRADLVRLEERPDVDRRIGTQADLSRIFHDQASELVTVLEKVNLPAELLNSDLARTVKDRIDVACLTHEFLKEHPKAWHAQVNEDTVKKIGAAL